MTPSSVWSQADQKAVPVGVQAFPFWVCLNDRAYAHRAGQRGKPSKHGPSQLQDRGVWVSPPRQGGLPSPGLGQRIVKKSFSPREEMNFLLCDPALQGSEVGGRLPKPPAPGTSAPRVPTSSSFCPSLCFIHTPQILAGQALHKEDSIPNLMEPTVQWARRPVGPGGKQHRRNDKQCHMLQKKGAKF